MLSETIFAFQNTVDKMDANVLTLVQSEIGRNIKENNELGTDHGPTNHALLIGNQVKGGIYRQQFELSEIYNNIVGRG